MDQIKTTVDTIVSDVHKLKQNKIYQRIKLLNDKCRPEYSTTHSACMDCKANVSENVVIKPGEVKAIPLGFILDLNYGTRARLYPRSGLALKKSITLLNAPGTIDADYTDEVCAIIFNAGKEDFVVEPTMKICQMDVERYCRVKFLDVEDIRDKSEEHLGFGSTGV